MKAFLRAILFASLIFAASLPSAIVLAEEKDPDPWRGFNEKIHNFNDTFDKYLLKPLAIGYQKITPEPVDKGVTNFFSNLGEPIVFINDLFQAKPKEAVVDLSRFVINTTVGIAGFFDVATKLELHKNNEDFGQTLGKWGVPSGPYFVIPFLGPSTVRDGLAKIPDTFLNPSVHLSDDDGVNAALFVLDNVDARADLLALEKIIIGDRYVGMRDVFLQTREHDVKDGDVKDDFVSEDMDDIDDW